MALESGTHLGHGTATLNIRPFPDIERARYQVPGVALANGAGGRAWDYDPVSDRFLVVKIGEASGNGEAAATPRIRIVLNWFEDLKKRVSAP